MDMRGGHARDVEEDMPEIRVIAVAFPNLDDAAAAESELRQRLDVEGPDVAVAEAGGERSRRGLRAVLAGRFRAHRRHVVDDVVKRHRGEVVAEVPERWVIPRGFRVRNT